MLLLCYYLYFVLVCCKWGVARVTHSSTFILLFFSSFCLLYTSTWNILEVNFFGLELYSVLPRSNIIH